MGLTSTIRVPLESRLSLSRLHFVVWKMRIAMVPHYWGCCKDGMGQHPSDMGQQCPAQDVLRQCEHRPPGCSHRHKLLPWWHFCLVSLSALFLSGYFRPNSSPFIPDYFQLLLPESSQGSPPQGMIQNTLLQQLCDAQHSFAGFTETVQPTAHTSPVTQSRGLLVQVGKPRHREHDPQAG